MTMKPQDAASLWVDPGGNCAVIIVSSWESDPGQRGGLHTNQDASNEEENLFGSFC